MMRWYLPIPLILITLSSFFLGGYLLRPKLSHTLEFDTHTKILVMKGDYVERSLSVPDEKTDSRFIFIMGKRSLLMYDTESGIMGTFQKELLMSEEADKLVGKEHLRIFREHFKAIA